MTADITTSPLHEAVQAADAAYTAAVRAAVSAAPGGDWGVVQAAGVVWKTARANLNAAGGAE